MLEWVNEKKIESFKAKLEYHKKAIIQLEKYLKRIERLQAKVKQDQAQVAK